VTSATGQGECIFCAAYRGDDDHANLVVHRTERTFIILNRFPYTNGHVMIVPAVHVASLAGLPDDTLAEMMLLTRDTEKHLRALYGPDGINVGLNIGRAAGAGIADHVHMHALPRWIGDTNFMSMVADTRVLPETLEITWERLRKAFASR
jgi:ATP adenylyltransferase